MKCNISVLLIVLSTATIVLSRSPYYDAIVVEGRDDSEDSENVAFEPDDCLLPAMAGPCRAGIPMYHYSADSGKCSKFRYGGCGGNGNRFQSRTECERRCSRVGGSNQKPASAQQQETVSCVRSPLSLRCSQGCFSSRDQDGCYECKCNTPPKQQRPEVCDLPPARGHCRALLPRWTYDVNTGKCQEFRFGGCDGNGNNFMSEADCLETCAGRKRGDKRPLFAADRYDTDSGEQQAAGSNYYSTDYTSAAASLLKYVFQRFWPGAQQSY